ncbi:hypothetical protein FRC04_003634 [Tulasnella sp. 424]|nr:hypothetical protein FRC04_003634 [Tulasnella sp. 424]KAG8965501.1 hypothetical protein FRC05_003234 [Tulasnella sp. 425]
MDSTSSGEPVDPASPPPYIFTGSTVTLPSYSAELRPQEQTLQSQPRQRRPSNGAASISASEYVYCNKYMTLNLGRKIYGTDIPSYGRNSIITGTLTVSDFNHQSHLNILALKITGKVIVVVSHPSIPIPPERRTVLFHTENLWSASESTPRPESPQTFSISFPLPTYARGSSSVLPPSFSSYSSSIELDVRYSLAVEMTRQGIHRNQSINTGFYYLPRSSPTHLLEVQVAPGSAGGKTDEETEGLRWKMVEANLDRPNSGQDGSVLGLPLPLIFVSGIPIPFRASIISLDLGLSERTIRAALKVQLIQSTLINGVASRFRFQSIVATGDIWKVERGTGSGIWDVTGSISGLRRGAEMSWKLMNVVEIQYSVQITLASVGSLPGSRWEEVIQLVTDEDPDEFALDEALERPAVGLLG